MNDCESDVERDDILDLADQLESEVPFETVSNVLSHQGWLDLLKTVKEVSPKAFDAMKQDLLTRTGRC